MVQAQYLSLSPLGFSIGSAAAGLFAVIIRALTAGVGYGMGYHMGAPYMRGGYGGGMMGAGGLWWFAFLAAVAFVIFCGIAGAVVAFTYNAVASRSRQR